MLYAWPFTINVDRLKHNMVPAEVEDKKLLLMFKPLLGGLRLIMLCCCALLIHIGNETDVVRSILLHLVRCCVGVLQVGYRMGCGR